MSCFFFRQLVTLTRVAVIHHNHLVNVAVVVKREFWESFHHRQPWLDVNWRLLFTSARRSRQIRPTLGILINFKQMLSHCFLSAVKLRWLTEKKNFYLLAYHLVQLLAANKRIVQE
jgi:hypothetical protein